MTNISTQVILTYIQDMGLSDCGLEQIQIIEVVNAINDQDMWFWIKDICPKNGFMFTNDENAMNIINRIDTSNHTGLTIGYMLRLMKKIADEILVTKKSFCAICHESNCEKQALMECGHTYHIECIKEWNSTSCPLCRRHTIPFEI